MNLNCQHICITNLLVSYRFQQILKNSPKFPKGREIKMDILTNKNNPYMVSYVKTLTQNWISK